MQIIQKKDYSYKETKIGKLPSDWKVKKIQKLLDEKEILGHLDGNHGSLYPKNNEFVNIGIPYISANAFVNKKVDFSLCKKLTEERAKKFRKGVAKDGDVLFAHNATVGPVAYLETDLEFVILSTTATYFRLNKNKLIPKYWLQFLTSDLFRRQYENVMKQSTRSQVPITTQRKFYAVIPTIHEQRKIADILSAWDDAIEKTQQLIDQLELRKKGLMQELLTGKKRLPGFDGEWKEVRLGLMVEEFKKKSTIENQYEVFTSSREGLLPQREYYGDGRISNRSNKGFNILPVDYITFRSRSDDRTFRFNLNQLGETGIISNYYPVFRMKNGNHKFLVMLLNFFSHKIGRYSVGTSQVVLSMNELKKIKFSIPNHKEQCQIQNLICSCDSEISLMKDKLSYLKHQKKGLMQQLLTGKKRVNV